MKDFNVEGSVNIGARIQSLHNQGNKQRWNPNLIQGLLKLCLEPLSKCYHTSLFTMIKVNYSFLVDCTTRTQICAPKLSLPDACFATGNQSVLHFVMLTHWIGDNIHRKSPQASQSIKSKISFNLLFCFQYCVDYFCWIIISKFFQLRLEKSSYHNDHWQESHKFGFSQD